MILSQYDCRECDVRWQAERPSTCWCCGKAGIEHGTATIIPAHFDGMTPEVLQALFMNTGEYDID